MFKHYSAKLLMLCLVVVTMTACASISGRTVAEPADYPHIETLVLPPVKPLDFIPESLVVQVPELQVEALPVPIRELSDRARVVLSESEIDCMAQVIYFEARGEETRGKIGVGYVVLNRMGHAEFPKTVCAVVYQKQRVKNKLRCQFSWVCDGKGARIRANQNYDQIRQIAVSVMKREVENPVDDSIFFRERSIRSGGRSQTLVAYIGQHGFFAKRQ